MNTPYYLIDEAALRRNLEILRGVRERTGCKILLAQKAFSMFAVYPIIAEYLDGATASGLFEARLAAEELQGENHVFSAAYRAEDIPELARLCDHVVFNSCAQLRAYAPQVLAAGKQAGLRINPECSTQEGHAIYDPCGEKSRLGVTRAQFDPRCCRCSAACTSTRSASRIPMRWRRRWTPSRHASASFSPDCAG